MKYLSFFFQTWEFLRKSHVLVQESELWSLQLNLLNALNEQCFTLGCMEGENQKFMVVVMRVESGWVIACVVLDPQEKVREGTGLFVLDCYGLFLVRILEVGITSLREWGDVLCLCEAKFTRVLVKSIGKVLGSNLAYIGDLA